MQQNHKRILIIVIIITFIAGLIYWLKQPVVVKVHHKSKVRIIIHLWAIHLLTRFSIQWTMGCLHQG